MEALLTAQASDYSPGMAIFNEPAPTDEADWIDRAKRADTRAFESLYRMHIDKVYGLCLRMTGNVAEAEDCAQDAFIQAWNKLDRFRGDSAFATWLHRIVVNEALMWLRSERRRPFRNAAAQGAELALADPRPDPSEHVSQRQQRRLLGDAICALPPPERDVLVCCGLEGVPYAEYGARTGTHPAAVKSRAFRARRRLGARVAAAARPGGPAPR